MREVIRTAEEVTGKKVPVQGRARAAPGDPPALVASSDKIQRELGWRPRYTELRSIVETGLELAQEPSEGIRRQINV